MRSSYSQESSPLTTVRATPSSIMVPTVSISQRQRTGSRAYHQRVTLRPSAIPKRAIGRRLDLDGDFGVEAIGARWFVVGGAGEGKRPREQGGKQDRELAFGGAVGAAGRRRPPRGPYSAVLFSAQGPHRPMVASVVTDLPLIVP